MLKIKIFQYEMHIFQIAAFFFFGVKVLGLFVKWCEVEA